MWRGWRKRALAYGVLVLIVVGTLYQLQHAAVEVDFTVDLIGVRLSDGQDLVQLKVEFQQEDGTRLGVTEYNFPATLHPDGPPTTTPKVPLAMPRGTYEVRLTMIYGEGAEAKEVVRRLDMKIEGQGTVRLRAAP
jgi:hypothetical protein